MKKFLTGILAKIFGGNAKKTHNNEYGNIPKPDDKQLQEKWPVPETPFMIVKLEESFFVTFREYRLTEPVKSIIKAWDQANHPDWQLHINLINAIILTHDAITNEIKQAEIKNSNKKFMSNIKNN